MSSPVLVRSQRSPMPQRGNLPRLPRFQVAGRVATNTKVRLITRIALGFKSPDALVALPMLSLGGHRPALPSRQ